MFKNNNSYVLYEINKIYWKIRNKIAKRNLNDRSYIKFIKSQNNCIWCKRIYVKNGYFCSKKCEKLYNNEKYQSFKHNNRCKYHKFQKLTYKNICWSCYKNDFINKKIPRIKNSFLLKLYGFKIIPTFRTSKINWNGDKVAFEQFLNDKNIKWFVYIKFYENKSKKIRPIVVGKSGSIRVNSSGSDLNFSTAIKDGASRQFINYNNFNWCYDYIMVKKCKNESHAYSVESKIMNKFDLFGS